MFSGPTIAGAVVGRDTQWLHGDLRRSDLAYTVSRRIRIQLSVAVVRLDAQPHDSAALVVPEAVSVGQDAAPGGRLTVSAAAD
jgi:hypothetical protein